MLPQMASAVYVNFAQPILKEYRVTISALQISVEEAIKHEDYLASSSDWHAPNDIALLRLSRPVETGPNIIPVCLPLNDDPVCSFYSRNRGALLYCKLFQRKQPLKTHSFITFSCIRIIGNQRIPTGPLFAGTEGQAQTAETRAIQ